MRINLGIHKEVLELAQGIKSRPDISVIMTDRALTYEDKVYSIETGYRFDLLDDIKELKDEDYSVNKSKRIQFSDQIMIEVKLKDKLKVIVMNEPSSRSFNPFGFGCFGLASIERVIDSGSNNFLVQSTRKEKFDSRG